jgi:hypothetical protein
LSTLGRRLSWHKHGAKLIGSKAASSTVQQDLISDVAPRSALGNHQYASISDPESARVSKAPSAYGNGTEATSACSYLDHSATGFAVAVEFASRRRAW